MPRSTDSARARAPKSAHAAGPIGPLVEGWFATSERTLPWRVEPRNPYFSLVSELMLQQTQVSRVVEFFNRFVGAFPTVQALAQAPEARVLALWAGLGYYRRARHLHSAAKTIVERFGGVVPCEVDDLVTLAGVGRYTAGAISSIAFGRPAPIVDGNVMRVLLRLNGTRADPAAKATVEWAWRRAGELVNEASSPARFNEGLMELGATVCLPSPSQPACQRCPLAGQCAAFKKGLQGVIPLPKPAKVTPVVFACSVVVKRRDGAVLLQQRPAKGMWGGLWECPTLEREGAHVTARELTRTLGVTGLILSGEAEHQTTHRLFRFRVYRASMVRERATAGRTWVLPADLHAFARSSAQQRVLRMAGIDADDARDDRGKAAKVKLAARARHARV